MADDTEAKDLAAEKMSIEVEEQPVEETGGGLLVAVQDLLDMWEDTDHEYYKDLQRVLEAETGDDVEDEGFSEDFEDFEEAGY